MPTLLVGRCKSHVVATPAQCTIVRAWNKERYCCALGESRLLLSSLGLEILGSILARQLPMTLMIGLSKQQPQCKMYDSYERCALRVAHTDSVIGVAENHQHQLRMGNMRGCHAIFVWSPGTGGSHMQLKVSAWSRPTMIQRRRTLPWPSSESIHHSIVPKL